MLALNGVALNSHRFMLAAAGINTEGPLGRLKLQGVVIAFARTVEVWLDDDDPALARTMARLDKEIRNGERFMERADDARPPDRPVPGARPLAPGAWQPLARGAAQARTPATRMRATPSAATRRRRSEAPSYGPASPRCTASQTVGRSGSVKVTRCTVPVGMKR